MYKRILRSFIRPLYALKRRFLPNTYLGTWLPFWGTLRLKLPRAMRMDYVDDVFGHRMYLDKLDSLRLSLHKGYEAGETRLTMDMVKPNHVVLDLGANIGYYTLIFSKLVGPGGRVYAFEPDPTNFELLGRNVRTNKYENATLVQKAVSDTTGSVKLYLSELSSGDHRIYDSHDGRSASEVEVIRLDDYFQDVSFKADFIKMDIQGAEHKALGGMMRLIERSGPVTVLTEFWPFGLTQAGSDPRAFLDLFKSLGFRIQHVEMRSDMLTEADPASLLKRFRIENALHTNLLCTRS
jgi:FkbM family methyltransferase